MFLSQCERPSFAPLQNHRQNYCFYILISILFEGRREEKSSGLNDRKHYPN
jgi:hypothetical protein